MELPRLIILMESVHGVLGDLSGHLIEAGLHKWGQSAFLLAPLTRVKMEDWLDCGLGLLTSQVYVMTIPHFFILPIVSPRFLTRNTQQDLGFAWITKLVWRRGEKGFQLELSWFPPHCSRLLPNLRITRYVPASSATIKCTPLAYVGSRRQGRLWARVSTWSFGAERAIRSLPLPFLLVSG